jgi:predicted negative regulator of RcsB-dependent stress response
LLGDLYLDKRDRAAARANFEKAVALAPEDAYYRRRLQEMSASPSPR